MDSTPDPAGHDRVIAPVPPRDRIDSLDVLRGVAVLGILVMNMRNYALPLEQFDNPAIATESLTLPNLAVWALSNVLFEDKMIALFSLLFGAGIVLMADRARRAGRSAAILHYRRMFWLFLIGLAHAYLLWYGDILNTYAVCGALLFPLIRLRSALLISLGALVLLVAVWIRAAPPIYSSISRAPLIQRTLHSTHDPEPLPPPSPPPESRTARIWRESVASEEAAYRGTYLDQLKWRARLNTLWHFDGVITFNLYRCAGLMLIGMGLMRLGTLTAREPVSLYAAVALAGIALGLTLVLLGFYPQLSRALQATQDLPAPARRQVVILAWPARYLGAAALALGYAGLILLICRLLPRALALRPFAAAGRMALTNYLAQTAICTYIFDGWGRAQWARWPMTDLALLILAIWVVQLVLCPIWLRYFAFGPVEWVWRSLTYWRPQPLIAGGAPPAPHA